MLTRISFIIASVLLLSLVIKLCMFQSTTIQKWITAIIFLIILGTFTTLFFVAKKSIPYALMGFVVIMLIFGTVAINIMDYQETKESFATGTDLGTDQTTIGYSREVDNEDAAITTNATPVSWLRAQADTASQQCKNLDHLEDAITKKTGANPQQGICYTVDGKPGQRTLSTGDVCIPLDEESVQCEGETMTIPITTQEEEETQEEICVPSASSMGCYDCSLNFDEQCKIANGENYGMKSVENCPSPYSEKCKATCGLYYFDGEQLDSDSFLTPCYDKNVDLNTICKNSANENNYSNFQKFGVYQYKPCPRRDQQRAICKMYYDSTYPTHPLNATNCVGQNQMTQLPALCKAQDESFLAYDIGVYDCPLGMVRANCASNIDQMSPTFYKQISG